MTAATDTPTTRAPGPDEHAPYYARYVSLVPQGADVLDALERQGRDTAALLRSLPPERATFRYAPGKWSIAESAGHVADAERVFSYRALRFARGDATPLPSFEQDGWVDASGHGHRPLASLADELEVVRGATLALLRPLDAEAWTRGGTASGHHVTVRALAWIIAGHELHHVGILRERYLR